MTDIELPEIDEKGAPNQDGKARTYSNRLFMQLHVYGQCARAEDCIPVLERLDIESVLYFDASDPKALAVLTYHQDPNRLIQASRTLIGQGPFSGFVQKHEYTMFGRTYASGRETDLEEWLINRPRRFALSDEHQWAIWYPLRRKGEFELLSRAEQGKILGEHALIGRRYGQAGLAHDIRLACHGLDKNDNEFVIGLLGKDLYPLSKVVQDMRQTQQTIQYIVSMGPFFIGKVCWRSKS
ncbi:MAG: chlorite dismutase family protein [Chlamydiota bacterium]|nr:chlorite dismutase family protein [Chlamydiota bacterium]